MLSYAVLCVYLTTCGHGRGNGARPLVPKAHVVSDREVAIYWRNGNQGDLCNIYPERHDRRSKKWPQDKKTLQVMGDREVEKFAGALRGDSFLLLPSGDCRVAISGAGLDRDVYRAIEMCDAGLSPEKICEKLGGRTEFPMELSEIDKASHSNLISPHLDFLFCDLTAK